MNGLKICKDCKYFKPDPTAFCKEMRLARALCTHPCSKDVDIITGKVSYDTAKHMRADESECGQAARFYEKEHPIIIHTRTMYVEWAWVIYVALLACIVIIRVKTM